MSLKEAFAKRLKQVRKSRGMTQEELAELVGVAPRHISFIETARSFPSCELTERLCNALNISYSSLFDFEDEFTREELIEKISELINRTDMKKLKSFYKIVSETL